MAYNSYGGPGEERDRPNPMVFGTPMQPKPTPRPDAAGATVPPMLGAEGGASPQGATPSFAEGGAIPDGDDDNTLGSNAGVPDYTTDNISKALDTINQLMVYGRKKHGLPESGISGKKQPDASAQQDDAGIPDDSGSDNSAGGDTPSFAGGGAIDEGESWQPPEDESAGLDTSAQNGPGNYANPPQGNPVQAGAQAAEGFLGKTFGPQGAIPDPHAGNETAPGAEPPGPGEQQGGGYGSAGGPDYAAPSGGSGGGALEGLDHAAGSAPLSSGGIYHRIVSWFQGSGDAASEVKKAEDASHGDAAKKAADAVGKIASEQGPDAGVAAIQYNRAMYNAKAGFAYIALNGHGNKPPDVAAAAKAATQATPHLLDGKLLTFAPDKDGVTASSEGETFKLTIPQFNQFLDIRKTGQYDAVFESGGALTVLKDVMKGAGEPPAYLQTGTGTVGQAAPRGGPGPQSSAVPQAEKSGRAAHPEFYKPSPDDSYETRAARMNISPALAKQQTYIDAQEQREEENKTNRMKAENPLGVARAKADSAIDVAKTKAEAWMHASDAKSASKREEIANKLRMQAAQLESVDRNSAAARAQRVLSSKIISGGEKTFTPTEVQQLKDVEAGASQAPRAPQAPQAQAPQQAANPGRKQGPDGRWYIRDAQGKAKLDPNQ